MRSIVIASILLGFASSPVLAESAVEELIERVEEVEKSVQDFHAAELEMKAAVPAKAGEASGEVTVNVNGDDSIDVGGKKLTLEELKAELVKLAEPSKDLPVRIRGDGEVKYSRIVEVIEVCQKAGLWKISFATERAAAGVDAGSCEDKLVAVAEIDPELDSGFFKASKTGRQPWIIEGDDGSLEDTMDGSIDADDLLLVEQTADCVSTHQSEHAMEFCDAVKTADGVQFELSGGAPAYMSYLTVTLDAKRQFTCKFEAAYPAATMRPSWKVTKKAMKLKSAVGEPGSRLRGWISVEFDEIDGKTGEARSYKIEGSFKPVIQSAVVAEREEDK